ncbi:ABC transporter permease [Variovorax sp. J22G21]|uniref:ABC transporter permease n=1 Tax=Variovorax fucosicus TaxID=3053517 RepID=UPI00257518A5|nr:MULTISPECIES: ABC transporter permease [unclassified Variovorax]MDM0040359.1 ABC transporter permease [Variovorax sp. J22R193]MDM0058478.1 ABC transporter permease [Variovorax sp. J22G47]MDM0061732.1 ABC transporter permease [Variovorax sp. J22G21]
MKSILVAVQRSLANAIRHPFTLGFSSIVLGIMVCMAIGGTSLAPYDPEEQDLGARLLAPGSLGSAGRYWLGTDALGRDILSVMIAGAAPALVVSLVAVCLAAAIGVIVGVFAGFKGGRYASVLLFLTNIQLAFPFFLLAVTIVGILRPTVPLVIGVIALGGWVRFARVTYADTMQIRELEYIEAVRVMRGSDARIVLRHILPNVLPNILVLATFGLSTAIIMESSLSFVGLGVPTATPTWGRMLSDGRDYLVTAWWLTIFPGLAIFLLVLSINILGERLRDSTDPKLSLQ